MESRLPTNMLSTSLTGLEVLQAGLRNGTSGTSSPPSSLASPGNFVLDAEELPRTATGQNALLSRTYSDPVTPGRFANRKPPATIPGLANPSLFIPPRNLSAEHVPSLGLAAAVNTSASYHFQVQDRAQQEPPSAGVLSPPGDGHNPDTDLGFEFEME